MGSVIWYRRDPEVFEIPGLNRQCQKNGCGLKRCATLRHTVRTRAFIVDAPGVLCNKCPVAPIFTSVYLNEFESQGGGIGRAEGGLLNHMWRVELHYDLNTQTTVSQHANNTPGFVSMPQISASGDKFENFGAGRLRCS